MFAATLLGATACGTLLALDDIHYLGYGGALEGGAGDVGSADGMLDDASSADGGGSGVLTTLAANGLHVCALVGGVVYGWGDDGRGQVSPFAAGCGGMCVQPVAVAFDGGASPVAVAAGLFHSCALFADGSALCWGDNASGELGVGPTMFSGGFATVMGGPYRQISTGAFITCAVGTDGGVFCWGDNSAGSLGTGTLDAAIQVSAPVVDLPGAVEVELGVQLACARVVDGGVDCWGTNAIDSGSPDFPCGAGAICTPVPQPVSFGDAGTATRISVGGNHACAVMDDTTVRCWGYNGNGQLGDGTTTSSATAVEARFAGGFGPVTGAVDIGCGLSATCAPLADGGVACWGDLPNFQFPGITAQSAFAVTIPALSGARHAALSAYDSTFGCFLFEDGGVSCAGHNNVGELGRGSCVDSSENFCPPGPVTFP